MLLMTMTVTMIGMRVVKLMMGMLNMVMPTVMMQRVSGVLTLVSCLVIVLVVVFVFVFVARNDNVHA